MNVDQNRGSTKRGNISFFFSSQHDVRNKDCGVGKLNQSSSSINLIQFMQEAGCGKSE